MLVDISKGGALTVTGAGGFGIDDSVHLALPWHSHTRHEMRVVWIQDSSGRWRVGLSRRRSGPAADREWAGLVADARKAFTQMVINRHSSSGGTAKPGRSP